MEHRAHTHPLHEGVFQGLIGRAAVDCRPVSVFLAAEPPPLVQTGHSDCRCRESLSFPHCGSCALPKVFFRVITPPRGWQSLRLRRPIDRRSVALFSSVFFSCYFWRWASLDLHCSGFSALLFPSRAASSEQSRISPESVLRPKPLLV